MGKDTGELATSRTRLVGLPPLSISHNLGNEDWVMKWETKSGLREDVEKADVEEGERGRVQTDQTKGKRR